MKITTYQQSLTKVEIITKLKIQDLSRKIKFLEFNSVKLGMQGKVRLKIMKKQIQKADKSSNFQV